MVKKSDGNQTASSGSGGISGFVGKVKSNLMPYGIGLAVVILLIAFLTK